MKISKSTEEVPTRSQQLMTPGANPQDLERFACGLDLKRLLMNQASSNTVAAYTKQGSCSPATISRCLEALSEYFELAQWNSTRRSK